MARRKRGLGRTAKVQQVEPTLHVWHRKPSGELVRTVAHYRESIPLADWVARYNAALKPGGSRHWVTEALGYEPRLIRACLTINGVTLEDYVGRSRPRHAPAKVVNF